MHYIGVPALSLPILVLYHYVLYHYPTVLLPLVAASAVALFTVSRERVRVASEGEARFHTLAETIPQIVWTAISGSGLDYCNHRWSELTGLAVSTAWGSGWQKSVHPDDLPLLLRGMESANPTGAAFEIEYRLRAASGDFRWHLFRAVPVCDSAGSIVKWFGTCVDIEDQRRNQQHLEEQIKVQTVALDGSEHAPRSRNARALPCAAGTEPANPSGHAGASEPFEPGHDTRQNGRVAAELRGLERRFFGDHGHGAEDFS